MSAIVDLAARVDSRIVLLVLLLVLDLWAGTLVLFSKARRREKTLWIGVIFLCPIIGCLFWYPLGPKWRPSSD
ncbi:MAG: PLDc N-terminal domain-containing protein [Gemmatimonadota bacterium]|nr:PLDc N-terminal domain-containing protein [Gemmatimonadota bacterium]